MTPLRRPARPSLAPLSVAFGALLALTVAVSVLLFAVPTLAGTSPVSDGLHRNGLVVWTHDGAVRGASRTTYDEWLGIPYAAPPVGTLRWEPPQPARPWSGVRNATRFGNRCVQGSGWDPGYETPKLTEDCLYLNVYVPHGVSSRTPVLLWIHGGGFQGGAGQDTDPRAFIDLEHVVYVTINYRLGALGFLDLPGAKGTGSDGSGQFGLLDQQAALRWVRSNIGRFGGDADDVTIAGQSAGAASVCDQLVSPTAKGLFARGIMMSGGCSMPTAASAVSMSQSFAQSLGCTDLATAISCLRSKTPAQLLAAQGAFFFQPVPGGRSFPLEPETAVESGRFNRVPVIHGMVHDEARLFVFQNNDFLGHPVTAAGYVSAVQSMFGADAAKVLARYPLSAFPSPSIALATVQTDSLLAFGIGAYAHYRTDNALSRYVPTFAYEFAEEATPQFTSIFRLQQKGGPAATYPFGATHVDDLGYLWDYLGQTLPYTDDELELADQMKTYWGSFVWDGNPNAPHTPVWPRYNPRTTQWMELKACETPPSSNQPPAACSKASNGFLADHKIAFWRSILH